MGGVRLIIQNIPSEPALSLEDLQAMKNQVQDFIICTGDLNYSSCKRIIDIIDKYIAKAMENDNDVN